MKELININSLEGEFKVEIVKRYFINLIEKNNMIT